MLSFEEQMEMHIVTLDDAALREEVNVAHAMLGDDDPLTFAYLARVSEEVVTRKTKPTGRSYCLVFTDLTEYPDGTHRPEVLGPYPNQDEAARVLEALLVHQEGDDELIPYDPEHAWIVPLASVPA